MTRLRLVLTLAALLTIVGQAVAAPPFYSAKAIHARIVDHETSQPIADAVVVALWILESLGGQIPRLHVADAKTNASGEFMLPRWGPKIHPPLTEFGYQAPTLIIFRHGYQPVRLINARRDQFTVIRAQSGRTALELSNDVINSYDGNPNDAVQESVWDGMTLRLVPFRGDRAQWLEALSTMLMDFSDGDDPHILKLLYAVRAERATFAGWKDPRTNLGLPPGDETFFKSVDELIRRGERK